MVCRGLPRDHNTLAVAGQDKTRSAMQIQARNCEPVSMAKRSTASVTNDLPTAGQIVVRVHFGAARSRNHSLRQPAAHDQYTTADSPADEH